MPQYMITAYYHAKSYQNVLELIKWI